MRRLLAALLAVLSLFTVGLGLGLRGGAAGQIGRALVPITAGSAWTPLVIVTADGTAATLDTGAFGSYPLLQVIIRVAPPAVAAIPQLTFNGETRNGYQAKLYYATTGIAFSSQANGAAWNLTNATTTGAYSGSILFDNSVLNVNGIGGTGSHGPTGTQYSAFYGTAAGSWTGLVGQFASDYFGAAPATQVITDLTLKLSTGANVPSGSTLEVWGSS